jgi:hypothetical protein
VECRGESATKSGLSLPLEVCPVWGDLEECCWDTLSRRRHFDLFVIRKKHHHTEEVLYKAGFVNADKIYNYLPNLKPN